MRKDRLWHELVKSGEVDGEFVFALSARSCGWTSAHNGIALSHAYSVLKAIEVQDEEGNRHRLVRVRYAQPAPSETRPEKLTVVIMIGTPGERSHREAWASGLVRGQMVPRNGHHTWSRR